MSMYIYKMKQAPLVTPGRWTTGVHFQPGYWWRRLWLVAVHSAAPGPSADTEPPYWQTPGSVTLPCFPHLLPPSCGLSKPVQRPGDKQWIKKSQDNYFYQGWIIDVFSNTYVKSDCTMITVMKHETLERPCDINLASFRPGEDLPVVKPWF